VNLVADVKASRQGAKLAKILSNQRFFCSRFLFARLIAIRVEKNAVTFGQEAESGVIDSSKP
jgi:hypothetical protein